MIASSIPRSTFASVGLALAMIAASPSSLAQSAGEKGSVAEALFHEGVALFDGGRVHEACEKFAESFRLDPANGTLQNLALCHEREGKIASAWSEFAQLAGRAAQAGQKEREQMARTRAQQLAPRVTRVRLVFSGESNVEQVVVDGQELGRAAWSTPLPLDPGEHAFVFAARAKKSESRSVRVASEGETLGLDVPRLEGDRAIDAPPGGARDEGTPGRRTAALVVGGAGVVALGLGTYFGLATIAKKRDGDARCSGRVCDADGLALQDQAHTDATISTIAFGAGLAAIGVGAYLWITSRAPGAFRVAPTASMRGAGVAAVVMW